MSRQQKQDPLGTIDPNRQIKQSALDPMSDANTKPVPAFSNEAQQHQSLHSKLMKQQSTGKQAGSYVSPSDDLMSPASSKLNAFKQKRFATAAKPRSLFAKSCQVPSEPNTPQSDKMTDSNKA